MFSFQATPEIEALILQFWRDKLDIYLKAAVDEKIAAIALTLANQQREVSLTLVHQESKVDALSVAIDALTQRVASLEEISDA